MYKREIDPVAQARFEYHIEGVAESIPNLDDNTLVDDVQRLSGFQSSSTELTQENADKIADAIKARGYKSASDPEYVYPKSMEGLTFAQLEAKVESGEINPSLEDIRTAYFGCILNFCQPEKSNGTYGPSLGYGGFNDAYYRMFNTVRDREQGVEQAPEKETLSR